MPPTENELDRKIAKARKAKHAADDAIKELVDLRVPGGAVKEKQQLAAELREIRGDKQKRIEELRERKKDARKDGADKAVEFVKEHFGVTESPYGSNRGPFPISECQEFTIGYDGVAWCGCLVAFAAVKYGGAEVPELARLAYTPYIDYDAGVGRNGLLEVHAEDTRPGDFAVFHFGSGIAKHVGMLLAPANSTTDAGEGNTSSGASGSQDNGGGLFRRARPLSHVVCFARPAYK